MPVVEHAAKVRVRFAETDAMQVAYYAEYFIWFEVARTELFRALGIPYKEVRDRGYHTPVVQAFAEYKAPAMYEDELEVLIRVAKVGRSSLRLDYEVTKLPGRQLLCTGYTVHVFVGKDGKSTSIPEDIRAKLSP